MTTAELIPTPDLFTHPSRLHGQRHVAFAQQLFDNTHDAISEGPDLFPALLDAAGDISGRRIVVPNHCTAARALKVT